MPLDKKLLALIFLLPIGLFAQNTVFSYQTVLRDDASEPLANTTTDVTIDILETSVTGPSVFSETQSVTSNGSGLISLEVGKVADLSSVDWSSGPYFMQVSVGGEVIGANQLLSVPYSLYANEAETANTFDYSKLTNQPDFTGWDIDVTDDFDGDYNSLINKPTTITQEQVDKVDNLTITSAIDLDNLSSDVASNTAKTSFPGFGTVPGTALEAGTDIWTQSGNNVFYNAGKVGINVPTDAVFGSSDLFVGGGIKYGSYPISALPPNEAGLLFYVSDVGDGAFALYDNVGLKLLTNNSVWINENSDVVTTGNVYIGQSLGIGQDIVTGQDFGFATILLKENNTRILFDDADTEASGNPYYDWQLTANDAANSGGDYFAIENITDGTIPFLISAGAPDHSFYMDGSGQIGIGTNAPSSALDVNGTIKASSFVGDGSGLTGITGATGGVSNAGSTTISAGTGQIDLQINGTTEMTIANNGNVGIGVTSPGSALEINGDVDIAGGLQVTGNLAVGGVVTYGVQTLSETGNATLEYNASLGNTFIIDVASTITVSVNGLTDGGIGQIVTLINNGAGTLTLVHNAAVASPFLITGSANVNLLANQSATFVFDGSNWYTLSISN